LHVALRNFAIDIDALLSTSGVLEIVIGGVTVRWHPTNLNADEADSGKILIAASSAGSIAAGSGGNGVSVYAVSGLEGGETEVRTSGTRGDGFALGGNDGGDGMHALVDVRDGNALAIGGDITAPLVGQRAGTASATVRTGLGNATALAGQTVKFGSPNIAWKGARARAKAHNGIAHAVAGPASGFAAERGRRGGDAFAIVTGDRGTAVAVAGEGSWVQGPDADRAGAGGDAFARAEGVVAANCIAIGGVAGNAAGPVLGPDGEFVFTRANGGFGGFSEARNPGGTGISLGGNGGIGRGTGRFGGGGGDSCLDAVSGDVAAGSGGPGLASGFDPTVDVATSGEDGVVVECDSFP
jgi:hypothetical protein